MITKTYKQNNRENLETHAHEPNISTNPQTHQDFINNIIPEMLTENFIPRTELRETTMNILNKRKEENG